MKRDSLLAFRDLLLGLVRAGTQLTVLFTFAGLFSKWGWFFDLTSHFRVQYVAAQTIYLFLALWWCIDRRSAEKLKRRQELLRKFELGVVLLAFLLNAALVAQLWLPRNGVSSVSANAPRLRLLQINVNGSNTEYERVAALIRENNIDVVAMQEVSPEWAQKMPQLLPEYKYGTFWPQPDNFGIATFSKIPLRTSNAVQYGIARAPSVLSDLNFDQKPLALLSTHPLPPASDDYYKFRNEQFDAIARKRQSWSASAVILGDLNTTSWSQHFSDLCSNTKLVDSRQGFGVQPSWPSGVFVLWIPIDHCLISDDLVVLERKVLQSVGSDHYPVLVVLARRK